MTKSTVEVGDNYCIELEGDIASCRVWSRPDLDFETGASLAAQKVTICRSLAAGDAKGMLFDLRDAPKVTGPKTQGSLALILEAWEIAGRPIAIVVSPASMQRLQLTRIARQAAPTRAEVFIDFDAARDWLELSARGGEIARRDSGVNEPTRRASSTAPASRAPSVRPAPRAPSVEPASRAPSVEPASRTASVEPARRTPSIRPTPSQAAVQGGSLRAQPAPPKRRG